jgi:hypothetical protein
MDDDVKKEVGNLMAAGQEIASQMLLNITADKHPVSMLSAIELLRVIALKTLADSGGGNSYKTASITEKSCRYYVASHALSTGLITEKEVRILFDDKVARHAIETANRLKEFGGMDEGKAADILTDLPKS